MKCTVNDQCSLSLDPHSCVTTLPYLSGGENIAEHRHSRGSRGVMERQQVRATMLPAELTCFPSVETRISVVHVRVSNVLCGSPTWAEVLYVLWGIMAKVIRS